MASTPRSAPRCPRFHVAEVGGGAEQIAVRFKHVDRRDSQRRSTPDLHALNLGVAGTG